MTYGEVVSVETRTIGTALTTSAAIGSLVLNVADVTDLPQSGIVTLLGDVLSYVSITSTEDVDSAALYDTITLAAPTTHAYQPGTLATLTPAATYKIALVRFDDDDTAIAECLVKHTLVNKLPDGPRVSGQGETVNVLDVDDELTLLVDDIRGKTPPSDIGPQGPAGPQGAAGPQGPQGDPGTTPPAPLAASLASGTTDAAASITFAHSLGVTPRVWQAWPVDTGTTNAINFFGPTTATSTTASFIVRGSGGNIKNAVAVSVHLVVYR